MTAELIRKDTGFIHHALSLAKDCEGLCAPNPAVGAVLVRDGQIIAEGVHRGPGTAHAEVVALASQSNLIDVTLYISLEPCCHWGRTPPCSQTIIDAGVGRVVYGSVDPNPLVAGRGAGQILAAGIDCQQLETSEITAFYRPYQHWCRTQMPWVITKLAMSLDAKIAGENGQPVAISGPKCAELTHQMRYRSDAILTTINTVINDDPQLNVRLPNQTMAKPVYILDSQLKFPLTAKLWQTAEKIVIFHQQQVDVERLKRLTDQQIECHAVASDSEGLNLPEVLRIIGKQGIHRLWVEVGARCFRQLCQAQLCQQTMLYIAPHCLGESALSAFPGEGLKLPTTREWREVGQDVVCVLDWES